MRAATILLLLDNSRELFSFLTELFMLDTLSKDFDDSGHSDAALLAAAWLSSRHSVFTVMKTLASLCPESSKS